MPRELSRLNKHLSDIRHAIIPSRPSTAAVNRAPKRGPDRPAKPDPHGREAAAMRPASQSIFEPMRAGNDPKINKAIPCGDRERVSMVAFTTLTAIVPCQLDAQ